MRGSRVKALRREFIETHGRAPNKTRAAFTPVGAAKIPESKTDSPLTAQRTGLRGVLRQIFAVQVVEANEWRRWKREKA